MLRVVLDTNTIVSALVFKGNPGEILTLANQGHLALFTSPFIINETQRVLARKFRWPPSRIGEATQLLNEIAVVVHPTVKVAVI